MTETPKTSPRPGMSPLVRGIVIVVGVIGIGTGVMKVVQGKTKVEVVPKIVTRG